MHRRRRPGWATEVLEAIEADGARTRAALMDTTAQLVSLNERLNVMATSLDNLKAADTDLQNEVATFLQDVLDRLNGDNPDIDAVTADIESEVANLKGNDPATPAAPPAPPAAS